MAVATKQTNGGTVQLTIDRNPDLEELPTLGAKLAEALAEPGRVELTIAAEGVSLALLQVLCSAHRTAAQAGSTLKVVWKELPAAKGLLQEAGFIRHVPCPLSVDCDCLWLEEHWS